MGSRILLDQIYSVSEHLFFHTNTGKKKKKSKCVSLQLFTCTPNFKGKYANIVMQGKEQLLPVLDLLCHQVALANPLQG